MKLEKILREEHFDAAICGAGLAAHLPGYVASKLKIPVFGIPCPAAFNGLDSLASIIQMPSGVPVLCSSAHQMEDLGEFLANWSGFEQNYKIEVLNCLVSKEAQNMVAIQKEIKKLGALAQANQIDLRLVEQGEMCHGPVVVLVSGPEDVCSGRLHIHVPIFSEKDLQEPKSLMRLGKMGRARWPVGGNK